MNRYLLSTLTLSLLAACVSAGAADNAATADRSGIDTHYIDPDVRAQDDFFTYLNGKWLKTTAIPSDRASWGTFMQLREDTQPQLLGIIEADQKDPHKKAGTDAQKIADLYTSFMDEKTLETLGYKPLAGELARIRTLKDRKGVPDLVAHLAKIGVATPYGIGVAQDAKESTKYATYIRQGGLGMPDRDYYLKLDDARMAATKAKYERHVARILALAGDKDADAKAKSIVAFETELAKAQWTKVELRDPVRNYNKMDVAQLAALTPGYDWKAALAAAGVANRIDYVIVGQPSYLQGLDRILADTDLWDGRVKVLQVTDALAGFVRVRVLVTAKDAPTLFDLRCHVREQLIGWLQRHDEEGLPRHRMELVESSSHPYLRQRSAGGGLFTGDPDAEDRAARAGGGNGGNGAGGRDTASGER